MLKQPRMKFLLIWVVITTSQVYATNLEESLVAPYANMLQETIASTQLQQQINSSMASIIANMAAYDVYVRNLTDQVLQEYHDSIWRKVSSFKSSFNHVQRRSTFSDGRNIIAKCLVEEGNLDVLANKINDEIKKCATVALGEMVNIVSSSINEAQTFMSIPQIIGRDIQRCGLSPSCRWDIVGDAISEAIQGLREITKIAVGILEDIFFCISNNIDPVEPTPNATEEALPN